MDDQAGDFDDFFRRYHRSVLGIALALVGESESARDVAQETMVRAFRDWARVGGLDRPDLWARRVAVNLAIDVRRRRARDLREAHRHRNSQFAPVDDSAAESSVLWEAVRSLPKRQRAAVVLRYVEDLPVRDIAAVLRVTDGTVKASLAHARASLARQLAAEVDIDDG
jgi:RNA polymerase sigma factor (sigma-70 family)